MRDINFSQLPKPQNRFTILDNLGNGVYGKVFAANDAEANDRKVAIKIQKYTRDTQHFILEEYKILKYCSDHMNIVDFYGAFRKSEDVWFALELCQGGPVTDLVKGLLLRNRRMAEDHIAYILKETIKGLIYLHENKVIHRDIKASNILITREGDVKISDFGLSVILNSEDEKLTDSLGSPNWMAPEVVSANSSQPYDNRVDVWALGIVAIELGDGQPPYEDMHPSRVLFQIERNPPPTLYRPANWDVGLNDFISECLVKNPEHRPYIMEVIEHPFLEIIPENSHHLSLELKSLINEFGGKSKHYRHPEINVVGYSVKRSYDESLEEIFVEDLAALDKIEENIVLRQLEKRMECNEFQTFIGDVLLILNPNDYPNIYGPTFHEKYSGKSRSDNAPHIYSIADTAYQNAIHHLAPQDIVLTGESGSGKTQNLSHLVDHLLFIGHNTNVNDARIKSAINFIQTLTHAATPFNDFSTRCILRTDIVFGSTGKVSGASFKVQCLEKWRVSSVDMFQGNFHIFYYLYDGINATGKLQKYKLDNDRNYRYFRIADSDNISENEISKNVNKFKKVLTCMQEFDFSIEQIETVLKVLSAILIIGEVRFKENDENVAYMENEEYMHKVADILKLDKIKLKWALTNYCIIKNKSVLKKKNTSDEARDARDVLANTLYQRIVDYVVNVINNKLDIGKAIFGEKYHVKLLDYPGFECCKDNHLPQLMINCLNEQFQYHYLQRLFAWESIDSKGEELQYQPLKYYDNKDLLDDLLQKPNGLFNCIDQASKMGVSGKYILEAIDKNSMKKVTAKSSSEFCVSHYTGRVTYNAREMPDKNRDFLPPEIIETMRLSENPIIKGLFTNKLDRTGNLISLDDEITSEGRFRFESLNRKNDGMYSQIRKMRTSSTVFRSVTMEILKELSTSYGTHFVRCVRSDLKGKPQNFEPELIRQQLRAMSIIETAKARQRGYPCRVSFSEFLRRYKFLAFECDENVDITRENCRLLLIRLKMEGWAIGKTKVFLKYYNEEYLSRLYEIQVRKIVKIQSILRGFLVKCKLNREKNKNKRVSIVNAARRMSTSQMTEDYAAVVIQQKFREFKGRRDSLADYDILRNDTLNFIRPFAKKWAKKSMFNVLLQYRSQRFCDFFNFSQQVHLFNSKAFNNLIMIKEGVDTIELDHSAKASIWLGKIKPSCNKLYFRLDDIPYTDTTYMHDQLTNSGVSVDKEDPWDNPYRMKERKFSKSDELLVEIKKLNKALKISDNSININFSRNPDDKISKLPKYLEETYEEPSKYNKNVTNYAAKTDAKTFNKQKEVTYLERKEFASKEINNFSSTSANKDFEYIKPTPRSPPPVVNRGHQKNDPISELKNFGRKSSTTSDDPPFNFQGMLRKTNFQKRDSMQNVFESVRRFSLKGNSSENSVINSRKIAEEIAPGLFMEGEETDL